ncbi:hypothetical protein [Flavobacterium sp. '19STA2R22 D10 B1']|uniref:hypothetical protein n=1 Tax=Flavobacterium aerium TaxID=3037261 RepID=UPI00278C7B82|nr:hypothetical protein [Flavobacterium sp. '19STA2R22 D10 B1']
MLKIKAKIYLYQYKARKTPFNSGYRPLFNFENDIKISGNIELINTDLFYPGLQDEVFITFISDSVSKNDIKLDTIFSFDEGLNILGEGQVVEVIKYH